MLATEHIRVEYEEEYSSTAQSPFELIETPDTQVRLRLQEKRRPVAMSEIIHIKGTLVVSF